MISPVSVWPVFLSLSVAFAVLYFLCKIFKKQAEPTKFHTLDGLRGFLAFFVFLHHSSIYFFCLRSYVWELPPSPLYAHFGSTSVALFFMITAFLFVTKLIETRRMNMDWLRFFVSRLLRLYPLYIIALVVVLLYAAILSHFKLNEPGLQLAKEIGQWFLFSVFDSPNINGLPDTQSFMISVLWSIKYEWLFYLLLPAIGFIFFKIKAGPGTLLITLGICYLIINSGRISWHNAFSFSGGVVAAFAVRSAVFCKLSAHWLSSLLIVACLVVTVLFFKTGFEPLPLILLSVTFTGIAGGNSLFGALTHRLSRELGQLSYGIYLLHGLLLFALFNFLIERPQAVAFSVIQHWLVISTTGGILIVVCFFLHHYLELPAMHASAKITAVMRKSLRFISRPESKSHF